MMGKTIEILFLVPLSPYLSARSYGEEAEEAPSGSTVCSSRGTRPTQLFHRVGESGRNPRRRKTQGNADQDRRKGMSSKTTSPGSHRLSSLSCLNPSF